MVATALIAACSTGSQTSGSDRSDRGGHAGTKVTVTTAPKLTGAELRYGASATRNEAFTYQPDVVILGGGASSIKGATADGLIWTIDGTADHADEIRPGTVLLATSFAAGRVLGVKHVGRDLQVALGPVALTDVIRDGEFGTDGPLPLTDVTAYSTPEQPGLQTDTEPVPDGGTGPGNATKPSVPRVHAAVAWPSATAAGPPSPFPPPATDIPATDVGNWHIQSSCCTAAQIRIHYDQGGARVLGTATLGFDHPGVSFGIKIGGGHLLSASVGLHGAAKLGFGIAAAVQSSAADFRGGRIQLPVELDIPLSVAGLPVTLSIHQLFNVGLGLSGRAELATSGEYALGGTLGFSLVDGAVSVLKPTLSTTKSALDNVQSIAVAPQGLTFSYAVRLGIGIGPPGLNAGLWYQVAAALGLATSGAQIDQLQGTSLVTCKTISLSLQGRYGVGYQIPKLVADAVNLFLRVFFPKARPLAPVGGPSWGPSILFNKSTPPCSK